MITSLESIIDNANELHEVLRFSQTEEELSDVYDYIQMMYADELREGEKANGEEGSKKQKRALKRDMFSAAKRAGLGEFAKVPLFWLYDSTQLLTCSQKFGLTPKQFGDNLFDNYATHTPIDNEEDPTALAEGLTSRQFPDAETVLKGTPAIFKSILNLHQQPNTWWHKLSRTISMFAKAFVLFTCKALWCSLILLQRE